jgi:superfamily II DNA or RNA helicase
MKQAYKGPLNLLINEKDVHAAPIRAALTFDMNATSICLAKQDKGYLVLPRHSINKQQLTDMGLSETIEITSNPMTCSFDMKPEFSIREQQLEAWEATKNLVDTGGIGGVLNLACGKGKTFLGLLLSSYTKQKTIIVSPQKAHLDNWKIELEKFFDFGGTIGWIQGKKREWDADIIFATVQTLANMVDNNEDIPSNIGLAIYDECHGMSALHFSKAADIFGGIRLGLSATPNRTDRNEGIFLSHIGPIFYSDVTQDLIPTVKIIDTCVFVKEADQKKFIDKGKNLNLNLVRSWLVKDATRNSIIIENIERCLNEGRTVYVLSHVVEHIEYLASFFPGASVIHGGTKADDRLRLLNTGNIVFATIQIGKEAYNRKELDTLFLVTPFAAHEHAAIAFEQSVGRIQRDCPGKKDPEVYLFIDKGISICKGLVMSLIKHSKAKGYKIIYA